MKRYAKHGEASVNGVTRAGVLLAIGFAVGAIAATAVTRAQAPGEIKRAILLTKPLAAQGYNGVIGRGEVPPGMAAPRHSHPGDELVILLEGEVEVELDGLPPVRVRAGEAMHVEAGRVHQPKSVGTVPAKFISVWIVEKDRPLTISAP
jgi:quercetin dioxygenase-like cupin family protein